jgi:tetratricopeptide (TPR) repeat protein
VSTERFQRLQDLFDQALEIAPGEREAWCRAQAGSDGTLATELLRLLDRNERVKDAPTQVPIELVEHALESRSDSLRMPERRIGRYLLVEEIGRGGMGRVFRAERVDPGLTQEVAIKIVRRDVLSAPVLKRFLVERQMLAALNHPGIARLLDAGEAADGTPFVAMELVRGEPLLDHCARHALGCNQRLALFRQILAAVAHAHRNLVVHRDIKPGNVLVDENGQVKLLDFGIAKALASADETVTAERFLTPAYAAPEQLIGANASVAADVYSLGALLYELLSGRPPFDLQGRSAADAERLILDTPPPALDRATGGDAAALSARLGIADLDAWRRQLRGDLDCIVQRALRKEPQLRYLSAEQFDADIERYLTQQPVQAAGSHLGYRFRKFIRRNRIVVGISTAAGLGLIAAFGLALRQAQIAGIERDRAQASLEVLRDSFKAADPLQLSGGALSARQVLETAARRVDALASAQPHLHGELTAEIAEVRLALGIGESSGPAMERALHWAQADGNEDDLARRLRLLNARRLLAIHSVADADAALTTLERELPGRPDVLSARAQYWLVIARPERAIPLAESALQQMRNDTGSLMHAEASWQLAEAQRRAKRNTDALATLDTLRDSQRTTLGDSHPRTMVTRLRRLFVLLSMADVDAALPESFELVTQVRAHYSEDSSVLAMALALNASALAAAKRFEESAAADEAAAEAYERSLGPNHDNTVRSRFNAAQMLAHVKAEPARVDRQFQRAIEGAVSTKGQRAPLVTFFRLQYAQALTAREALDDARLVLLPAEDDPDLGAVSQTNRDAYRSLLRQLFGPIDCAATPSTAAGESRAARAARLVCRPIDATADTS